MSCVVGGSCSVAVGLFLQPLLTEFHWANGVTSAIATAFTLASLLAAPVAGAFIDKFGARALMCIGLVIAATGFSWARFADSAHEMIVAFVLVGMGYCAAFYVPISVVTTSWMGDKKSIGMGIVLGATSIGAAGSSMAISWSIMRYGWRNTLEVVTGLIVLMLPVVFLTIECGPSLPTSAGLIRSNRILDASNRISLSSPTFVIGAAVGALFNIGMAGIYYHVVPVLVSAGYSTYSSGMVLGATWVLSAVGSLVLGAIADRRGAQCVLAGALVCCALGIVFLIGASETHWGFACVVGFAVLWGSTANSASQFLPVIFAEHLGSTHLGILLGIQSGIAGVASSAAPLMTGVLYDKFNSYRVSIVCSATATLLAALLAASMYGLKTVHRDEKTIA